MVIIRHIWQFLCSVRCELALRRTFLPSAPRILPWKTDKKGKDNEWAYWNNLSLCVCVWAHHAGRLTLPSRCSCSVLTVSLSLVSCSWVALRSCWSLVAAWPRSLDSFFSFSRRSCSDSSSKHYFNAPGLNMETQSVQYSINKTLNKHKQHAVTIKLGNNLVTF